MEEIKAWKTSNDRVFEDKLVAEKVQRELDAIQIFGLVYFHGIIENAEDIVSFLLDNKHKILALYGMEIK